MKDAKLIAARAMNIHLASLAVVLMFGLGGMWAAITLEHQEALKARINQEVHPYAVLAR